MHYRLTVNLVGGFQHQLEGVSQDSLMALVGELKTPANQVVVSGEDMTTFIQSDHVVSVQVAPPVRSRG